MQFPASRVVAGLLPPEVGRSHGDKALRDGLCSHNVIAQRTDWSLLTGPTSGYFWRLDKNLDFDIFVMVDFPEVVFCDLGPVGLPRRVSSRQVALNWIAFEKR